MISPERLILKILKRAKRSSSFFMGTLSYTELKIIKEGE